MGLILQPASEENPFNVPFGTKTAFSDLMLVIINTRLSQSPALNRSEDKAID